MFYPLRVIHIDKNTKRVKFMSNLDDSGIIHVADMIATICVTQGLIRVNASYKGNHIVEDKAGKRFNAVCSANGSLRWVTLTNLRKLAKLESIDQAAETVDLQLV